jgi:hypothetical protein
MPLNFLVSKHKFISDFSKCPLFSFARTELKKNYNPIKEEKTLLAALSPTLNDFDSCKTHGM